MRQSISDFKSKFSGGARPNLFEVKLQWPDNIIRGEGGDALTDTVMIKAASLPASVINTIEVPFRGRKFKVAGDRTFESWTITVINDTDMSLRNKFELWMDLISRNSVNIQDLSTPRDYMRDLMVHQLNNEQEEIKSYQIHDAFPVNISAIELNYETNDQIEEFTVEFSYQFWTSKESGVADYRGSR
jgi:hypothetical protein